MSDLLDKVRERMNSENISVIQLTEITNLGRATIHRFLSGEEVSKRTYVALNDFMKYNGKYKTVGETINVGQLRIPKEHYDYLSRYAEDQGVSILDMIRLTIENAVENDYLWKSFSDHINLTEKAVRNVMSKVFIPFIKQQDKTINSIENYVEYLEELIIQQGFSNHSSPELREQIAKMKDQSFTRSDARRYKRSKV